MARPHCQDPDACNTNALGECSYHGSRENCTGEPLYCTDPNACNYNGENFIPAAIKRGAKVIITKKAQYKKFQKSDCIFLTSNNVRKTYAEIASKYYKEQPKLIVGVTGTNGKTSTAWYTNKIWTLSGIKSASIGTLGIDTGESIKTTNLTTPDPVILSKTLYIK